MVAKRKKTKLKSNRGPTHKLKISSKDPDSKMQDTIGVGWENIKGGISIKLNPCVNISWLLCEDHFLTLWPIEDEEDED